MLSMELVGLFVG